MSAHSPAPWREDGCQIIDANKQVIAEVFAVLEDDELRLRPHADANARLIAAAPDLLAALSAIVASEDSGTLDDAYYAEHEVAIVAARAALAKVRG